MASIKLKKLFESCAEEILLPAGFAVTDNLRATRRQDLVEQLVGFQPGIGRLAGRFIVNLGWKFHFITMPANSWHVMRRLGAVAKVGDRWFDTSKAEAEACRAMMAAHAVQFLDERRTIAQLLRLEKREQPEELFGSSAPTKYFNWGSCLASVGDKRAAKQCFDQASGLLRDEPDSPIARAAQEQLRILSGN